MALHHRSIPMIEYHKAKRLLWDPREIDLARDRDQWAGLSARERDLVLRACRLFLAGEEAVTHDLAPLLVALRREGGHVEEEMFLTTQLFEESKHFEWFERWLEGVAPGAEPSGDLGESYAALFFDELPRALNRVLDEPGRAAQIEAAATYHMIIEGVLAETGYYGFSKALKSRGLLPGLLSGVELVQRDEARHIAYGVYLIQRLLGEEPGLRPRLDERLNALLPLALGVFSDVFAPYGEDVPFGLDAGEMIVYAGEQFDRRLNAIERMHIA